MSSPFISEEKTADTTRRSSSGSDFADFEDDETERTAEEIRSWDRETLTQEEEVEKLLTDNNTSSVKPRIGFKRGKGSMKKPRIGDDQVVVDREVMYSLDEDGQDQDRRWSDQDVRGEKEGDTSGSDDGEVLQEDWEEVQLLRSRRQKLPIFRLTGLHILIALAFVLLLYGAWNASSRKTMVRIAATMSNGTHTFAPTTLLISLDGFRADFLARNLSPTLESFVRTGVSPKYMLPAFPSLTFPNHFTLATGLHPESHGIVGNSFFDPISNKEFYYTDPDRSMQPEWWNAEPIWLTAELAGVRSAIHMWPGSEAHIGSLEPSFLDEFNEDELLDRKVERIFTWLDLPGPEDSTSSTQDPLRPQFIAAYVPNVDADGHKFGPNSTEIRTTITEVDNMLGSIFQGIEERNLTHIVNIIVVSDHGMATTSNDRLIQLEDLIDTSLIEHIDGWPLYGLRPYDHSEKHLNELHDLLVQKSLLPEYRGTFSVHLRDSSMPDRYHFSNNPRIAPLWLVPKAGWAIVTKEDFDIDTDLPAGNSFHPNGLHGYDHEHPLMRAIFVARGPAFPHLPGSEVDVFQNTEVYNIVCDSLGISPKENNGTIRLPFRTTGVHDRPGYHQEGLANQLDGMEEEHPSSTDPPQTSTPPEKEQDDEDKSHEKEGWWDWFKGKVGELKGWAGGIFGGDKDKSASDAGGG